MRLESGRMSSSQISFLTVGFIFGVSLVIPPSRFTGKDTWVAILIALAEALMFAWLYVQLAVGFPGKTFVGIARTVFGDVLGMIVSSAFIAFLFVQACLVPGGFALFLTVVLLSKTPLVVLCIGLVLVSALAVRHGIEVISRCSLILVPITIVSLLATFVMLLPKYDWSGLFPFVEQPISSLLTNSHQISTFSLSHSAAFLMVLPFAGDVGSVPRYFVKAVLIAGLILAAVSVQNVLVLGNTADVSVYPTYDAVRLIEVGELFTRFEALAAINLLTMGFLKLCVFYYGAVLGVAQLAGLRSYLPLVWPMGALIVVAGMLFSSTVPNMAFYEGAFPYIATVAEMAIPLMTFIVAKLRGVL